MATTQISPTPVFKAFDNNGAPLYNGQLFTYAAGTTTPQITYTDSTGNTPNTNPIILNSRGETNVWLNPSLAYKFALQDSLGNPIWTVDNLTSPIIQNPYGIATGTNTIAVNSIPSFGSLTDGITVAFKVANTTTANATLNANSTGPFNLYYSDGTTQLVGGALIINNIYTAMFDSSLNGATGGYIVLNPSRVTGSFTGIVTGYTVGTTPTPTITYQILQDGRTIYIELPNTTGTSNATTATITNIPVALTPTTTQNGLIWIGNSGSGAQGFWAMSGTTLAFGTGGTAYGAGGFTNTGAKSTPGVTGGSVTLTWVTSP